MAEWAARANRWFQGDATVFEPAPQPDQAGGEGAAGPSPTHRLPFELVDAPPVTVANASTDRMDPTVSADAVVPVDTAFSADTAASLEPTEPPSPPSPTSPTSPQSPGEADFNLGLAASRLGRWREAAAHLRRAIELDGGRAAAYFYLGEALNHMDDLPGALQAYQRSVELLPGNPRALYGMGIVLDRMNRPDAAAPLYRRSRELQGK